MIKITDILIDWGFLLVIIVVVDKFQWLYELGYAVIGELE